MMDSAAFRLQETDMDLTREILAYSIIVAIVVVGIPVVFVALRRRQRRKLRQRGIKRYGH